MIIKMALVAALVLGSASMAAAATNRAHRAPSYQTHNVALSYGYGYGYGSARESWMDRASRSTSSGGN